MVGWRELAAEFAGTALLLMLILGTNTASGNNGTAVGAKHLVLRG
jgi:glycerol uptake facilitator-like aquaporin